MKHIAPSSFDLDNRMTVVLFAGMGGACDGLEAAGFHVHVAINHDPISIAVHKKRHPHTRHLQCDVFEACPREVTAGRGVRILHASPDCTHFSVAKGSKPVSRRRRSLAWVICRWAGTVRPETITMENVQEIKTWGPLIAKRDPATGRVLRLDGTVAAKGERTPISEQWLIPDPKHKGRIWQAWLSHLKGIGYSFDGRVMICADHGIPTIRKRFFGIARADGGEVFWPEQTHAPRKDAKELGLKPWVGAYTIINWSLPVKSIFGRKKPLAEATLRRTARGVMRYVVEAARPFIIPITHSGDVRVHGLDEPLRTLTTAHRGELSVVVPHLAKFRNGSSGSDVSEPLPTVTANSFEKRPGGAIPIGVVSAFLAQHNDGPRAGLSARHAADPVSTITTTGSQQGVVAVTMGNMRGTNRDGRPIDEPLATVSAGGSHAYLILGFLQHYFGSGKQYDDLRQPVGAMTGKARYGLVEVMVNKVAHYIEDIGIRMLEPEEGAAAHGFKPGDLPSEIVIDGQCRRLTKTAKYHLVGNSVPPRMIQLIAECNVRREFSEAAE